MAGLFSHAIAAFQGFFSRGFWFGAFLPVAMFAAVNLFLAWLAGFDWAAQTIGQVVAKDWVWAVPLAAALIVLAYALAPLVEVCRAVLDGRRLPTLVFEWLRGEAYARKNASLARLAETDKYLARTQKLRGLVGLTHGLFSSLRSISSKHSAVVVGTLRFIASIAASIPWSFGSAT